MSKELIKVAEETKLLIPENSKLLEACNKAYEQKYKDFTIASKEDDEIINTAIVKIRKIKQDAEKKRKVITSKMDEVKKDLMIPEKGFKAILDSLTEKRNDYANKQYKAVKNQEKELQIKANKKQERDTLFVDIKTSVKLNLNEKIKAISSYLDSQLTKADIENVDSLIKLATDKVDVIELDGNDYNNFFFSQYQYLSSEEYTDLIAECKASLTYDSLNAQYKDSCKSLLSDYIKALHNKKAELIKLSTIKDTEQLKQAEKEAKAKDEQLRKEKEEKAKLEAEKLKQVAEMEKAKATLKAQTGAVVATLSAKDATQSKGAKVKKVAKVQKVSLYPELVSLWIKTFCIDEEGKKLDSFVKAMDRFVQDLANHESEPLKDIDFVEISEEVKTSAR